MPTIHIANLSLSLEKSSPEWQVAIAPQYDARWTTLTTSYAWDFTLRPLEGRDLVELRIPAQISDQDHGDFTVTAETMVNGQSVGSWTASSGWLCSAPIASGTALFVRVDATPVDPALPLAIPASANPRGGGHVHVKTAGGGDGLTGGGRG
jgi:hypothetical protein